MTFQFQATTLLDANNLRLWRACPSAEFDFKSFNTGDYFGAVKAKQKAESITSVLYPNDSTSEGKELRLKQEYFFCAATLNDIIRNSSLNILTGMNSQIKLQYSSMIHILLLQLWN